nr:UDP-glucuronic acid decarboxylase family protein [Maritalea mobilis]
MSGRTIVITGGAGFLGSHLCRHHLEAGARVLCVDNLSTGRLRNIEDLLEGHDFKFVKHDIIDPYEPGEAIDYIFNMACPASPPKYQLHPIRTFDTSVRGSHNLLELAMRRGARILQASTSEVYGDPAVSPQAEDYRGNVVTMGPRACYDEGKRAAETLFYEYNHLHKVDTRVARIFNTYGPAMDPEDGRVVSNFIVQALQGHDLTVYGDGTQTRSFCYVDDLVAGLMALMYTEGDLADPVNLGNPVEFTILELADLVLAETGSTSALKHLDLPKDDPKIRRPNIEHARDALGWEPHVPLIEGIRRTIPYFAAEIAQSAKAQV